MAHLPVLLPEVLEHLAPADGEVHVDATYGGGGYSGAVLAAADCRVLAVDRDLDAIVRAEAFAAHQSRLIPMLGRFGDLDALAREAGIERADGVMFDIGVSSFHLDEAERGFSLMRDGPLDMRMGRAGPSAADVVNQLSEADLANLLFRLGEEKQSRRIARAIVKRRAEQPFETTLDLASVISDAVGGRRGAKTHPATRSFQAIRIYVNEELTELERGLGAAERLLKPGGRLVVVTFHSLEDRIAKTFLRARSGGLGAGSRHLPGLGGGPKPSFSLTTRKAVEPSERELADNPRARSARLRAATRTDAPAWPAEEADLFGLPPLSRVECA